VFAVARARVVDGRGLTRARSPSPDFARTARAGVGALHPNRAPALS
jgi:hypothetical protein